ncbi:hypothetical protein ACH5RR_013182 [Cinchona calisaya]|uniref:Protein kinase domain-containing protein n=1 Tax=Cinchona calisaya TaxID=153742 RepID=A0ABD2ZZB4_9GENT
MYGLIDEHVQREIMNHRSLNHPSIIRFKEVFLTPTHLAIVMEYAAGGELFEKICNAGRFSEDEKILSIQYSIPDYVRVSKDSRHLLSQIFVADPEKRISIQEIKKHLWFLKNVPVGFMEREETSKRANNTVKPSQSNEEVLATIQEARTSTEGPKVGGNFVGGSTDLDDADADCDIYDLGTSGEFVCAL